MCTYFTINRDPLRLLVSYFHFVSIVRLLYVFKGSKINKGYSFYDQTLLDIIHIKPYHLSTTNKNKYTHTQLFNKNLLPPKRCLLSCNTVIYLYLSHLIFHFISNHLFFTTLQFKKVLWKKSTCFLFSYFTRTIRSLIIPTLNPHNNIYVNDAPSILHRKLFLLYNVKEI